uniref:Thiazole synthase n=1 Tax=Hildenbrandia rubra TaxID=31481 RepID=A0A1C9CGA9_9FLOR|nr:thiamin biosynthesis protein G [Hildenbrandia rubra]AOM67397.1 thiamin biosynthesis protein G [Hildenbrandia rubra]
MHILYNKYLLISLKDFVMFSNDLCIAGRSFKSRLMLGTGKYKSLKDAKESIYLSSTSIVTVAVRRAQKTKLLGSSNLVDGLDWKRLWLLPNTAGCQTAAEAIRVAVLGREMAKKLGQENNNFVKLEVIPDSKYLFPDPLGTLKAAEYLIKKNFDVLPYINADPLLAKQLEDLGCSTIMPLASPIGSGQGLQNLFNLKIIIRNSKIPVIIDAGIATPSDASKVMELGAEAVLVNTAVAQAGSSAQMAIAMKLAIKAGRLAYLADRILAKNTAQASSTNYGIL